MGVPQTSVLVVDDHKMIADSLRLRLLGARSPICAFAPVSTAYTLALARASLMRAAPDLVLLDYHLGQESGLDLFPVLEKLPRPPVTLMLAASGDPTQVIEGLSHADGWVSKGAPFEQLLVAVGRTWSAAPTSPPAWSGPSSTSCSSSPAGSRGSPRSWTICPRASSRFCSAWWAG